MQMHPIGERNLLSDALILLDTGKIQFNGNDVIALDADLRRVLERMHACAMVHGAVDADHIIIQRAKVKFYREKIRHIEENLPIKEINVVLLSCKISISYMVIKQFVRYTVQ